MPLADEQEKIIAFLNRETIKIDALIAEQRKLIKLLKEKRQATISHAVTKGLNPDAPMKDSGIEWLGQVPAHWEVIAMKRLARLKSGDSITAEAIKDEDAFPVYGGNGFRGYTADFTHEGDYVLIGRQGALCGNINYASGRFWASEHAIVAVPLRSFCTIWFGELLTTMNLNQYSISAAQPGLSAELISNLLVPYPPYPEQFEIAKFLQETTQKIDSLAGAAENAITLLQERRPALIAVGKNPNADRKKLRADMSLGGLFEDYMERYSKKHKRSWKYDEREINKFLSHWFKRKLSDITKQEIQRLHETIRDKNGLYQANRLLERLTTMYNKAIEWGWEGQNPATGIKKFREKSRDRFVQTDELPRLFAAIANEANETVRDYIMLSLLTGARKSNVLAMRWDEISFDRSEWRIPETKNGEPVTLPLVAQAIGILQRRRRATNLEWVLPSDASKSGHLADPKRAWARVMKDAGITDLRIHDIRRTLGSYQAITGASLQVIGKSLGHKSQQATAIYARLNLDPVRQSVERATQAMIAAGKA